MCRLGKSFRPTRLLPEPVHLIWPAVRGLFSFNEDGLIGSTAAAHGRPNPAGSGKTHIPCLSAKEKRGVRGVLP